MPRSHRPAESLSCRSRRGTLLVQVALLAVMAATNVPAAEVRAFTDRDHRMNAPESVQVVELDAAARIELALSAELPSDPIEAAALIQQRLRDGGDALQRRLAEAYQGITDAWSLGVTKIPAVIVDRRYVIYGETDAARALARIEEYRRTEP